MAIIEQLIQKEGWRLVKSNGIERISAYGQLFPKVHPVAIHLKLYRESTHPDKKYEHMKAAHDYIWPDTLWHYWTERRFRKHCEDWKYITYAGGAACSKSYDAAKIASLFWLANPKKRTVIVASTSLESLQSRIWGYVIKFLRKTSVQLPYQYMGGNSPKIIPISTRDSQNNLMKDTIHGMFAVAARQGEDERVISTWLGRHPDEAIMVVLDESTDMPPALVKALPNLESGVELFQCLAIGNSLSKFDLHGAMSTPKHGWGSIDPMKDTEWETTQDKGLCLFFNCYESPAIHETDPVRKDALSKFLITADKITKKENEYGKESDAFWRFVLGFWRIDSADDTVISQQFISDFSVFDRTEWSGVYPLHVVAGLDPAFSTGGDQCILRLAILGVSTEGKLVLDFRGTDLQFKIPISATSLKSADIQIADKVIEVLNDYNVPLSHLCVDASGQGRSLAEVIRLQAKAVTVPIKIYSIQGSFGTKAVRSFDVVVKTNYELWFAFREFIHGGQIKGLDHEAVRQLTTRKVIIKAGKPHLETKRDYKVRMGAVAPSLAHSPDEADSCALVLQSAMINYGFAPGQTRIVSPDSSFIQDKMWVFQQLQKGPEDIVAPKRISPPVANFTGKLEDMHSPFGWRFNE